MSKDIFVRCWSSLTATPNTALGNIAVTLTAPASGNTSATPANVNVTSGASYVKFGALGITANAPTNNLSSSGQRFLSLDTNGLSPGLLILNGGVTISASGQ